MHCSLQLDIVKDQCYATIDLNSIFPGGSAVFDCRKGYMIIDKKLWKQGVMKAEFSFDFKNKKSSGQPVYWKGRIYKKIGTGL